MRDIGTLLEALPYIREFHGRTVVIKYGGAAMSDPDLREEFARDVVLLKYVGMNPVVVHGGGPDITSYMERLEMPVEFVSGLRVSDEATVEIAKMVLVGKVNKDIVLRLGRHGQPAVGLCGDDGRLLRVERQTAPGGEDIGFVGRIARVNADVLHHIAQDYIPVIASVGADSDGRSHNINADEAAGAIARELGAYKVIYLTDVAGWLRDPRDARNSWPSSPLSPTADCPWRFRRRTMSLLTLPTRTIFAISTVSLLETRKPPTNSTGISRRSRTSGSSTGARSSSSTAGRRWRTRRCVRTSRATSCS